ncbi:unnamed protein product, partial [Didymodactylos carnosus]
ACCLGYFRVHRQTSCVENLAYGKRVWLNYLHERSYDLAKLVDGYDIPPRCLQIDNSFTNEPTITIDLNKQHQVAGVIIKGLETFSHLSQSDYMSIFNLDRIYVYVTREVYVDLHDSSSSLCSFVTRLNYSVYSQRLHFICSKPVQGRYLHVKATGIRLSTITAATTELPLATNYSYQHYYRHTQATRQKNLFKANFCEVYVYN